MKEMASTACWMRSKASMRTSGRVLVHLQVPANGTAANAQPEQLADPVAALMQHHQADGHRNDQQIELARPA